MTHSQFSRRLTATTVAVCAVALVAACSSTGAGAADPNESTPAAIDVPNEPADDTSDAGDEEAITDEDTAGDSDDGDSEAVMSGGIDTLESDALHAGVEPAAPNTAYIEIEGERLEFTGVECSITNDTDAEAVNFTIENETSYGPTELWVSRAIGWNVGFDYEEELVQLSLVGGEFAQISMAQNSGEEDGSIEWHSGDGPDPLLTVMGSEVVATGTLEGHPGSDAPVAGEFVMAANCG